MSVGQSDHGLWFRQEKQDHAKFDYIGDDFDGLVPMPRNMLDVWRLMQRLEIPSPLDA